jgi:hypothetical protein
MAEVECTAEHERCHPTERQARRRLPRIRETNRARRVHLAAGRHPAAPRLAPVEVLSRKRFANRDG